MLLNSDQLVIFTGQKYGYVGLVKIKIQALIHEL